MLIQFLTMKQLIYQKRMMKINMKKEKIKKIKIQKLNQQN